MLPLPQRLLLLGSQARAHREPESEEDGGFGDVGGELEEKHGRGLEKEYPGGAEQQQHVPF